jgi:hypothetical protein
MSIRLLSAFGLVGFTLAFLITTALVGVHHLGAPPAAARTTPTTSCWKNGDRVCAPIGS